MALKSFERQPGETDKGWAAFQMYRDLPPSERSIIAAYRLMSGRNPKEAPQYWRHWVVVNKWEERAADFDRHKDELIRREEAKTLLVVRREQANTYRNFQLVLAKPVLELIERIQAGTLDFRKISNADLIKLALLAAKVMPSLGEAELKARGATMDEIAPEWTGPVQHVQEDDEKLAAVWAVLEHAGVAPRPQPTEVATVETTAEVRQLPQRATG